MAAPRGRGLRPGGVVRAALRLVLLVGLGFGIGLLLGVVTEEPELLAGHLRGEGESVSLIGETQDERREEPTVDPSFDPNGKADLEAATERPARQAERIALLEDRKPEPASKLPIVAAAAATSPAKREQGTEKVAIPRAASSVPGSSGRWAIQVGAFSDEAAAARLADGLGEKGYPVELLPAADAGKRWRVRVQPVAGESEARSLADRLKREERLPTWVIPMEAGSGS